MKKTDSSGIFLDRNKFYTINPECCKGIKVYNEKFMRQKNVEYRSWNPFRSKLAAAFQNGFKIKIKPSFNVLYLGAATGTTVSHVSDIIQDGIIFAVESSPIAMKKLIEVSRNRRNIISILQDANHPDRYQSLISSVDMVYQDISQRNQAEIFIKNIQTYLKKTGTGIIMVKARSIDVSLRPKDAYEQVCTTLKKQGLKIVDMIDLKPYEKDHMAILVKY